MRSKENKRNNPAVAIVDSGLCPFNKNVSSNVIGGINLVKGEGSEYLYEDTHGHGTLCASIVRRMEPTAPIYVVKILDHNAAASSRMLLRALLYLLTIDVRVINLSIATANMRYSDQLNEVCKILNSQGKLIICSLGNRCLSSIPAIFDSVIGVQSANFNNTRTFWFNPSYEINCIADGTPILAQGLQGKWGMFGGNSKAAAVCSGLIMQMLKQDPNLTKDQLIEQLFESAVINSWERDKYLNHMEFNELEDDSSMEYPCDAVKQMVSIVSDILNLTEQQQELLYQYKLTYPEFHFNPEKSVLILQEIEDRYTIKLNYEKINYFDFQSIYSLLDLVNGDDGE